MPNNDSANIVAPNIDPILAKKEELLSAFLENAPFNGMSARALGFAAKESGIDEGMTQILAPNGAISLIDYWFSKADEFVAEAILARKSLKIREKATLAIRARLEFFAPHKEALGKALAILALPHNLGHSLSIGYRFSDIAWRAMGDKSTDFNYYTKRTMLLAADAATGAYFLNDDSEDFAKTWEFLDRRIGNIMQIEKTKAQFRNLKTKIPDPVPLLARLRYGKRPMP